MPRTLSSVTTCAVAQFPLPEFACNRKRKFQCKFFFHLSSRSRHGSSSANRSSIRSGPFRSGDAGSVSSVRMAWQGRFDAVRLVHFGHSSAVDPVRAISASSNPIDPGSVGCVSEGRVQVQLVVNAHVQVHVQVNAQAHV